MAMKPPLYDPLGHLAATSAFGELKAAAFGAAEVEEALAERPA